MQRLALPARALIALGPRGAAARAAPALRCRGLSSWPGARTSAGGSSGNAAAEPPIDFRRVAMLATAGTIIAFVGTMGGVVYAALQLKRERAAVQGQPLLEGNPLVYLDVVDGDRPVGRLVVQLRRDAVPAAADNFLALATAPLGFGYRNSALHGVEKGSRVFGGDFYGSGLAGQAAGGRRVPDEAPSPPLTHLGPGTVAMVTAGPGTINSQFYVTLRSTPLFDGVHPVVGYVQNEQGHALLAYLDKCAAAGGAGNRFRARHDFRIAACGVLPRPATPGDAAALLADGDGLPELAAVGLAGLNLGKG